MLFNVRKEIKQIIFEAARKSTANSEFNFVTYVPTFVRMDEFAW